MYKSAYVNIDFFKRNTSGSLLCIALHLDFFHLEMGSGMNVLFRTYRSAAFILRAPSIL